MCNPVKATPSHACRSCQWYLKAQQSKGESTDSASINKAKYRNTVTALIFTIKHYAKHSLHAYVMQPCNAPFNLYLFSHFTGNAGYTTVDVYPCLCTLAIGTKSLYSTSIGTFAHHQHDGDLFTHCPHYTNVGTSSPSST